MSGVVVNATGPGFVIPTLADDNKSTLCVTYIVVGIFLMILNLMFFAMVIYEWKFARKWPLIFGMFAGNVAHGTRGLIYGAYELILLKNGIVNDPYSNWNCMLTMMSTFWLMGTSLPATFQLLIGVERVTAIVAFQWFSMHWNYKKLWIVTGISYVCTAAVFLVPAWWLAFSEYFITTRECFQPIIVNFYVSTICVFYAMIGSLIGVMLTIFALIVGRAKLAKSSLMLSQSSRKFGKQVRLTGQLTAVALFDLALVTIPTFLGLSSMFHIDLPPEVANYNPVLTSFYCCFNMCLYVCTQKDFRLMFQQFMKRLGNSFFAFRDRFRSRVSNTNV